jgi:23S rRNA (pseudouridine1915-N3)-methyltransferase
MKIAVAAIGRLRAGPELELLNDYASRIRASGRAIGVTGFEIMEAEAPKGLEGRKRQLAESELLDRMARSGARRVVLDERGTSLSSESFSALLAKWRDDGVKETIFLIGGADGHEHGLRESADLLLSFGKATFPHMLVRVLLTEQIYRAVTILSGHPYHRG